MDCFRCGAKKIGKCGRRQVVVLVDDMSHSLVGVELAADVTACLVGILHLLGGATGEAEVRAKAPMMASHCRGVAVTHGGVIGEQWWKTLICEGEWRLGVVTGRMD